MWRKKFPMSTLVWTLENIPRPDSLSSQIVSIYQLFCSQAFCEPVTTQHIRQAYNMMLLLEIREATKKNPFLWDW